MNTTIKEEKLSFEVNGVGVDAGLIMIWDEDRFKDYDYQYKEKGEYHDCILSHKLKIPKGEYRCVCKIEDIEDRMHHDYIEIERTSILKVTSGNVIVSDPCYCIGVTRHTEIASDIDYWIKFLRENDNILKGEEKENGYLLMGSFGGDGVYDLTLELQRMEND